MPQIPEAVPSANCSDSQSQWNVSENPLLLDSLFHTELQLLELQNRRCCLVPQDATRKVAPLRRARPKRPDVVSRLRSVAREVDDMW